MCLLDIFRLPEGSVESHKAVTIKMKASPNLGLILCNKQRTGEQEFKTLLKARVAKPVLSHGLIGASLPPAHQPPPGHTSLRRPSPPPLAFSFSTQFLAAPSEQPNCCASVAIRAADPFAWNAYPCLAFQLRSRTENISAGTETGSLPPVLDCHEWRR